jgi:cytochrome c peroxidase
MNLSLLPARRGRILAAAALATLAGSVAAISEDISLPNMTPFTNDSGVLRSYSTQGAIDLSSPFFQSLGSNGRSCGTCHEPSQAWTVTPAGVQQRFASSQGLDPIFRTVDGADCPSADVSTVDARRKAFSMLLSKALIRVSIGVPSNAEFEVSSINDPHKCAQTTPAGLALYRRPLPACNLPFLTTVMWDGRETFKGESLEYNLSHQAMDATLGHAEAVRNLTPEQVAQIVSLESSVYTAQSADGDARNLATRGATGGPLALSQQKFYPGINDPLGGNPSGEAFNPVVFTLFDRWSHSTDSRDDDRAEARASIARGQELFNTLQFDITGVTGLNDLPGVPSSLRGTCTVCHDAPNVGNHSLPLAINIGVADYPAQAALDMTGLPVYTIRCSPGAATPIGQSFEFQTTDPGRALITGKCADVGKMKGPVLRGLAARAPYFHNGSATTLRDVVNFYDERFKIDLTEQQKSDLVAFLQSL